ncbi:MAG: energy transducer TonB [Vicinamibacterales bacterium]
MRSATRRAILTGLTAACGWLALPFRTSAAQQASGADSQEPRTDARLVPPRPVHQEKPKYTKAARKARIHGELVLRAVVDTDGSVDTVTVVKSLDATYGLDDQGIAAARKWRFTPGTIDGKPVRVRVTIALDFTL